MTLSTNESGFVAGDAASGMAMSLGYTGNDDRVAAFVNQLFAPEIAVASISLPTMSFGGNSLASGSSVPNVQDRSTGGPGF